MEKDGEDTVGIYIRREIIYKVEFSSIMQTLLICA